MSRPPPLTNAQKQRLSRLEPALRDAVRLGDYERARRITAEIQQLLRPTGHETRLMQAKNWLFEAALAAGDVNEAKAGFVGVRGKTNKRTRVYLEATALLALCFIREGNLDEAEPLIAEVLKDDKYIKSPARRREFHNRIIQRFDEEGALSALRGRGDDSLSAERVHDDAVLLIQSRTDDEILANIGDGIPREVVDFLLRVDQMSRNQLPPVEIKYLPLPRDLVKKEKLGRTIFGSVQRVLWRSLCDPESEVYRAWFQQGFAVVLNKKYIAAAVAGSLSGMKLGYHALAVSCTALLMKMGIEVFCDRYRPESVMEARVHS